MCSPDGFVHVHVSCILFSLPQSFKSGPTCPAISPQLFSMKSVCDTAAMTEMKQTTGCDENNKVTTIDLFLYLIISFLKHSPRKERRTSYLPVTEEVSKTE